MLLVFWVLLVGVAVIKKGKLAFSVLLDSVQSKVRASDCQVRMVLPLIVRNVLID